MRGLLYAIRAFVYLGVVEALSYPLMFVDRLVSIAAIGVAFYLGGELLAEDAARADVGTSYFVYAMIGYATLSTFEASLTSFKLRIRHYQLNGVLEACVMTRTPLWQILVATPSYDILRTWFTGALAVGAAHWISNTPLPLTGALGAGLVLALGCVSFVCLGLISASAVLVLKQGEPITRIVSLSTLLFGGVFFPRELLPAPLAQVAGFLPVAPTLDAMRHLLADPTWSASLTEALLRLALLAGVLLPLTAIAFRAAVRRVLLDGSMGHY